jgi:DHA1 family bicyclomycin/chloramphenicol resistance-like MFS transporter
MEHSAPSGHLRNALPLTLLSAIAAQVPLAVDMYLPAIPSIADNLDTTVTAVQNSLSIFLLGFGLGMLLFGPMADRHGRRPVALLGIMAFAISSMLLTLSTSLDIFLILRFLQGFLGAAASVTVPAMIRDCYGKDTAKGMSAVFTVMLIAPLISPLLGSMVLTVLPWEGIFYILTAYTFLVLGLTWKLLPETLTSEQKELQKGVNTIRLYGRILARKSIYPDLATSMLAALTFFIYLTSISFVYITWFEVEPTLFGFFFGLSAASLIVANLLNRRLISTYDSRTLMRRGMQSSLVAALILLTLWLVNAGLIPTVFSLVYLVGSLGIASINIDSLVLLQYPNEASSAAAVTGTLRFGSGALAGPLLVLVDDGTVLPIAMLLTAALLLAVICQLFSAKDLGDQ